MNTTYRYYTSRFAPLTGGLYIVVALVIFAQSRRAPSVSPQLTALLLVFCGVSLLLALVCFLARFYVVIDPAGRTVLRSRGLFPLTTSQTRRANEFWGLVLDYSWWSRDSNYRLWLVDQSGNRVCIYRTRWWRRARAEADRLCPMMGWLMADESNGDSRQGWLSTRF